MKALGSREGFLGPRLSSASRAKPARVRVIWGIQHLSCCSPSGGFGLHCPEMVMRSQKGGESRSLEIGRVSEGMKAR